MFWKNFFLLTTPPEDLPDKEPTFTVKECEALSIDEGEQAIHFFLQTFLELSLIEEPDDNDLREMALINSLMLLIGIILPS